MQAAHQALTTTAVAAALCAAFTLPAHAAGSAEVNFTKPENYADTGRSVVDRERTLQTLRVHFEQLGQRLPDGQSLNIEVLDVDLAGEVKPTRRGSDLRVLKGGADWPRMSLKYTLVADGKTLKSGTENLADMAYLQSGTRTDTGELAYERSMIERWFVQAFVPPVAAAK